MYDNLYLFFAFSSQVFCINEISRRKERSDLQDLPWMGLG